MLLRICAAVIVCSAPVLVLVKQICILPALSLCSAPLLLRTRVTNTCPSAFLRCQSFHACACTMEHTSTDSTRAYLNRHAHLLCTNEKTKGVTCPCQENSWQVPSAKAISSERESPAKSLAWAPACARNPPCCKGPDRHSARSCTCVEARWCKQGAVMGISSTGERQAGAPGPSAVRAHGPSHLLGFME